MAEYEYKEGILFIGGQVAADSKAIFIAALSACTGNDIQITCDLLNQLLQSFSENVENLKALAEELQKVFEVLGDICEPCRHRGTRHGSSIRTGKQAQAKANIKWREKYRPP